MLVRDSVLLPSHRIRALVRLVAEVREIALAGGDPGPHAAEGLRRLLGADVCGIVAGDGRVGSNFRRMINVGITESTAREIDDHYLVRSGTGVDPAAAAILVSGNVAALRRELVCDRVWYRSDFVNLQRRQWGFDDSIYGMFRNGAGMTGIGCSRAWRSSPFDETDRALAEIFVAESGAALFHAWNVPAPSRLAAAAGPSSPEPAVLNELRAHLCAKPDGTIGQMSRALGMSERSLQRRLAIFGTTYRAEVARARVDAARVMLAETDVAVTSIALEVGCASSQNFSALFRRLTGLTPRAWRLRARAPAHHHR